MREPDEASLLDMLLYARRIRDRLSGVTREDFEGNDLIQMAVAHMVQIIGEAAARTDEVLRARYPNIPWHDIVGMRNRLVHDYRNISMDVVWVTATEDVHMLIAALEPIFPDEPPGDPA